MNDLNLNRAFPDTPEAVRDAIYSGCRRGAHRAARRKLFYRCTTVAALTLVVFGVLALALNRERGGGVSPRGSGGLALAPAISASLPAETEAAPALTATTVASPFPETTPAAALTPSETNSDAEEPLYYSTGSAVYYHVDAECSGMQNAVARTLTEAEALGQQPCPVCCGAAETEDEVDSAAGLVTGTAYEAVYATQNGVYYHAQADCSGMAGATEMTVDTALCMGKYACPVCVTGGRALRVLLGDVYTTAGGLYFHQQADCSGLRGATALNVSAALEAGDIPCPVCVGDCLCLRAAQRHGDEWLLAFDVTIQDRARMVDAAWLSASLTETETALSAVLDDEELAAFNEMAADTGATRVDVTRLRLRTMADADAMEEAEVATDSPLFRRAASCDMPVNGGQRIVLLCPADGPLWVGLWPRLEVDSYVQTRETLLESAGNGVAPLLSGDVRGDMIAFADIAAETVSWSEGGTEAEYVDADGAEVAVTVTPLTGALRDMALLRARPSNADARLPTTLSLDGAAVDAAIRVRADKTWEYIYLLPLEMADPARLGLSSAAAAGA